MSESSACASERVSVQNVFLIYLFLDAYAYIVCLAHWFSSCFIILPFSNFYKWQCGHGTAIAHLLEKTNK